MAKNVTMPKIGVTTSAKLSGFNPSSSEERVIYTTDDAKQYIEVGGKRINISDVITVSSLKDVTTPIDGKFYRVKSNDDTYNDIYQCCKYAYMKSRYSNIDSMPLIKLLSFVPVSVRKYAYCDGDTSQFLIFPNSVSMLIYGEGADYENIFYVKNGEMYCATNDEGIQECVDNPLVAYTNGKYTIVGNVEKLYTTKMCVFSCETNEYMITDRGFTIDQSVLTANGFTTLITKQYDQHAPYDSTDE